MKVHTRKVVISVKFEAEIEILRETDQRELDIFKQKIDGVYGGWHWIAVGIKQMGFCLQSGGYYETESEAFEDAKESVRDYIEDHIV